jgi:hypothetical protein
LHCGNESDGKNGILIFSKQQTESGTSNLNLGGLGQTTIESLRILTQPSQSVNVNENLLSPGGSNGLIERVVKVEPPSKAQLVPVTANVSTITRVVPEVEQNSKESNLEGISELKT